MLAPFRICSPIIVPRLEGTRGGHRAARTVTSQPLLSPHSWLKPDLGKKAKHKTQIKKKTLNPEFNEVS